MQYKLTKDTSKCPHSAPAVISSKKGCGEREDEVGHAQVRHVDIDRGHSGDATMEDPKGKHIPRESCEEEEGVGQREEDESGRRGAERDRRLLKCAVNPWRSGVIH